MDTPSGHSEIRLSVVCALFCFLLKQQGTPSSLLVMLFLQGLPESPLSGFAPALRSLLSPFCWLLALLPPRHWRVLGSRFCLLSSLRNTSSLMALEGSDVGGQPHLCVSSPSPLRTPDTQGTPTEQIPRNSRGRDGTPDSSLLPVLPNSVAQIPGGCWLPCSLEPHLACGQILLALLFKLYPVSSCFLSPTLPLATRSHIMFRGSLVMAASPTRSMLAWPLFAS